jgi:hypothetical protein
LFETALHQWQDGERRLAQTPEAERRGVEIVIDRIVAELRWRLGGSFAAAELAELYDGSSSWSLGLALACAPGQPLAWEQWVADVAFYRYLRRARDWPPRH